MGEDITLSAKTGVEDQETSPTPTQPSLPVPGIDLQSLLLALSRQVVPQQQKKRYRGMEEPDPFSGGVSNQPRAAAVPVRRDLER